jgi:multidrug resistance efflux pump
MANIPERQTDTGAPKKKTSRKQLISGLLALALIAVIAGTAYWLNGQRYVYTDKALVSAPLIKLAPHAPGELKKVFVSQGDHLSGLQAVARVGDEMIDTQVAGTAVIVQKDIGTVYQPGQAVVTMIDPRELRVVAQVEEDKGLKDIHVGQSVLFSVDAFPSNDYVGEVEAVSQTSHEGDVVFNISDTRQENNFDVKISYDESKYPELQNGMSAKVWIVK